MKNTKPPRIPMLPLLSLILLIAVIVFWVRSRQHGDIVGFFTPKAQLQALASDRKGILLFFSDVQFGREKALSAETMSSSSEEFREIHEFLFDPVNEKWKFLGFRLANGTIATGSWKFHALIVPYWAMVIPLAILPFGMFRRLGVRWRRGRRGQCLVCGYDLRHSADRCPECGEPIRVKGQTKAAKLDAPADKSSGMSVTRFLALSLMAALIACVLALFWRGREARATGAWQLEEAAGMHTRLPEFAARGTFSEAIDLLQQHTRVPILVKWPHTVFAEFYRESPVDVHFYDVDLGTALHAILAQATQRQKENAQIAVVGGRIVVAETSDLPQTVGVYSLQDVEWPAPVDPDPAETNTSGLFATGFSRLPAGPSTSGLFATSFSRLPAEDKYDAVESLIVGMVHPAIWSQTGGSTGAIRGWGDRLFVYQTQECQAAVREFMPLLCAGGTASDSADPTPGPHADLNQPIAELKLDHVTVADAIEQLRRQTHANILVHSGALYLSDHDREEPIRLHARDITLGKALSAIFNAAGNGVERLTVVNHGVIEIGSADMDMGIPVRVYDVRQLVADDTAYFNSQRPPHPLTWGSGTVTNTLFSGGGYVTSDAEAVEEISSLIESTVATDTWNNNGGTIGMIREMGGRLFIRQTPAVHQKIPGVLKLLRSSNRLMGMQMSSLATEIEPAKGGFTLGKGCQVPGDPAVTDHADLSQSIAELKFESTTLEQAIDSLREMTHANIVVYWDDFAAAGIRLDHPIKLHMWDTTLGRSLGVIISLAGGDGSISCVVHDGVVVLAAPAAQDTPGQSTRLYDVRDIIDQNVAWGRSRPTTEPTAIAGANPQSDGPTREEIVEHLTKMVEDEVSTETWKDNGGSVGSIREFAGRLLITQTPDAHRRLVELLRVIRAGGAKDGMDIHKARPQTRPATPVR